TPARALGRRPGWLEEARPGGSILAGRRRGGGQDADNIHLALAGGPGGCGLSRCEQRDEHRGSLPAHAKSPLEMTRRCRLGLLRGESLSPTWRVREGPALRFWNFVWQFRHLSGLGACRRASRG